MAALVGALLLILVVLSYYAYRAALRQLDDDGTNSPDPPLPEQPPETPAEVREHELSCQLLDGRIDPAAYQREMTELALHDQARHGDPR